MAFEPERITKQHVLDAIKKIEKENIELESSTRFDVMINGKPYPPKEVMRYAHELMNGEHIWNPGGGPPTNKYLIAMGFEIKNKGAENTARSYYVLGATWDGEDQFERFVKGEMWENGYKDKFLDVVNDVGVNDRVAIKSSFAKGPKSFLRIKAIGTVVNNPGIGKTLKISWDDRFPPFDLEGYGSYRNTIQKVTDQDVDAIFNHLHTANSPTTQSIMTAKNIILYGPPGTGKTYNSIDKAVEIATGKSSVSHAENKRQFDELRAQGQIEFVTFHQNYSYEDFMVGLKPDIEVNELKFVRNEGVFYEISKRAQDNYYESKREKSFPKNFDEAFNEIIAPLKTGGIVSIQMKSGRYFRIKSVTGNTIKYVNPSGGEDTTLTVSALKGLVVGTDRPGGGLGAYYYPLADKIRSLIKTEEIPSSKNFVLVIDEINRANISKVFGELITLLEDDKRLDEENELKITLPNGEKEFGVPPNLYIIGTMNTADKSIALIDIALRRRFEFVGYYPEYEELNHEEATLLKSINEAVFKEKKSADYLIGHAYFIKHQPIHAVLKNKVVPLLMEYFSGKTDIVSKIFAETGWNVTYNTTSFSWDIALK